MRRGKPWNLFRKAGILYHSDLPYPPIRVKQRNPVYAKDMLDNLGGANSEMSAVSLYFYNFLVTAENREISEAFRQISIVEMHHMEIFGTLARQLGEQSAFMDTVRCAKAVLDAGIPLLSAFIRPAVELRSARRTRGNQEVSETGA